MQKLQLLHTRLEWVAFILAIALYGGITTLFNFVHFTHLTDKKYQRIEGVVVNQYIKHKPSKSYTVLKIRHNGKFIYTTAKKTLPSMINKNIKLKVITNQLTFGKYLKGTFYLPSFHIKKAKDSRYQKAIDFVQNQHQDPFTKEFFSGIFLASSIDIAHRKIFNLLGISHLVAISGYHITLLSFLLYLILSPIYSYCHRRYYPYRNKLYDLSIIIFAVLLIYTFWIGAPPSLIRAMVMVGIGIFFIIRHFKILSFKTLLITVSIILASDVSMLFSIGFWFSVAGVFYIYLFLHYFSHWHKALLFIGLNGWLFFAMQPIVHYIFPVTSFYQLLSPLLTMAFNLFYPLELFLHTINQGDILDTQLLHFINLIDKESFGTFKVSSLLLSIYLLLSLGSIRYKYAFILLHLMMVGVSIKAFGSIP